MKIDITYRNLNHESLESTRVFVDELVRRHLKPHLETFNAGQLRLHLTVEKQKLQYRVVYRMHLPPRKVLVARASDENLRTALQRGVDELTRQTRRHHANISGREQWKRKNRRQMLKDLKVAPIENGEQQSTVAVTPQPTTLLALLPRLESYIRHELTYLRANGDLLEGYPSIEDIRDEAFIQLQTQWDGLEHTDEALYPVMLKTVNQILEKEVIQTTQQDLNISLESLVPKDATDQAEDMVGEEAGEFFQPYEQLHIEDLIPDSDVETPEQQAETEAVDACYQLMTDLPILWRRTALLVYREQLSPEDVGHQVLNVSPDEVRKILSLTESFMQTRLHERGLISPPLSAMLGKPESP